MAQWGALVTQPNRALQLYRDKDFPLDVSQSIYRYVGTGGEAYLF